MIDVVPFESEEEYKYKNPPLTKLEQDRYISLQYVKSKTKDEQKEYLELQNKDRLHFYELMDGMEEVNNKMVDEIEKKLKEEQPTCHFTKMNYEEGLWICEHCGHEKESIVAQPFEDLYY